MEIRRKKTVERIYLTKEEFVQAENEVRFHEHLRRYAAVRRFCYGKVLDFACGCGYGSHLLAVNPDVSKVIGIDIDEEAVTWAKQEYTHEKIEFLAKDVVSLKEKFDTLVCLETIEHLQDLTIIQKVVENCNFGQLIISFPDKKSTHFNPFHFQDFVLQDIADLFPNYLTYYSFRTGDVQFVLLIKLPESAPSHIFRNIRDL
ncbi:class I SAM-dependent methyltransferase [Cytophagaceae bacterium YF14B1]|uniref:Class I SAM-dependent methyltransferase n=1 Tax=Xanthocytophaga flava TaxID=3048013 RepID=A0AAE3U700_9BACT|nr:class I SAM-dependent methyltransferase [Xanthocytophaga flavus]MDJ1482399.1 class I SAM-dependent methyltransferase [Xanthocytophaga flavus]